ncbi:MAG: HAMP domain-containing sensor histidine kinase, partial [Verrucomicrobiota bacterium]
GDAVLLLEEAESALDLSQRKIAPTPQRLRIAPGEISSSGKLEEKSVIAEAMPAPASAPAFKAEGNSPSVSIIEPQARNVIVQQSYSLAGPETEQERDELSPGLSKLQPQVINLDDLTRDDSEGAVSRLIDGGLHILFWKRHPRLPGSTFWTELDTGLIEQDLKDLIFAVGLGKAQPEISIALLDSEGELVSQTVGGFSTDWSRPFVAEEVGQLLPRWEVAAYLIDPTGLSQSARTLRLTLSLIVIILIGSIGIGSWLILRAVTSEMRMAERKTDFVSNVSHELKTPLTSIRMFSDLLSSGEVEEEGKTQRYASVISKESARLSRLINRLLDFSRLDRGEMKLERVPVELVSLARETVEQYREQIESEGFEVLFESAGDAEATVSGDPDAIAQVLLNLISNAEKYAAGGGEIRIEIEKPTGDEVMLSVLDRGPGISRSHERRIFEKFYRVDESIDSGIEGSGIGLALSRQIVELHRGTIEYRRRKGGGSQFLVTFPLENP